MRECVQACASFRREREANRLWITGETRTQSRSGVHARSSAIGDPINIYMEDEPENNR